MRLLKKLFFLFEAGGYVGSQLEKENGDFLSAIKLNYFDVVYYQHPEHGWTKGRLDWFSKIHYKTVKWGKEEITFSCIEE